MGCFMSEMVHNDCRKFSNNPHSGTVSKPSTQYVISKASLIWLWTVLPKLPTNNYHHQLSSSGSEGWHIPVQTLHWHRSWASLLKSSKVFSCVHCLMSSSHIHLGLPCAVVASNLPSNIWSASSPLDPFKTWPVKAILCFWILLHTQFIFLYSS